MSDAATTDSRARAAPPSALDRAVEQAAAALIGHQRADGHWCYELEADATIPAEYMLLQHYLGAIEDDLQRDFAVYLRAIQGEHGGWPLFHGGDVDLSATVKAYFALKAAGDSPDAPHMARARAAVLARGGAARSNVFTRIQLALFGELPWTAVPEMPVEIMLLPRWFPFHLSKVSYWSRTVIVPLLVLMALKPRAKNPRGITVHELFAPGTQVQPPRASGSPWAWLFNRIDDVLRLAEPHMPAGPRQRAIDAAVSFVTERLNGDDGLGGIYPAIANSVMMFECLGYAKDDAALRIATSALRKLVVRTPERSYCQPCLSPVWDTALAAHALLDAGGHDNEAAARRGLEWLAPRQGLDLPGGWAAWRPDVRPGGWAFQYANPHYPDLDDTAVVAMAFDRADRGKWREPASGSLACSARRVAGRRSTPTTSTIISTTSRSPITARCSTRRPKTSARAACRSWRSAATRAPPSRAASIICAARSCPTVRGSAAGAPITSTAPGRCCARSTSRVSGATI